MTHRKHVHAWEIDPVAEAIGEHLKRMVSLHEAEEYLTTEEQNLFHVLYRFENNRVGSPSYPKPENWGTVANHLGLMVPLYSIDSFRGESELGNCSPNCEPALVNLPNMEDF